MYLCSAETIKTLVMELRHLISFVAVADTGSMSNAAIRCHITQGAISHHIKSLEDELDTVLIERRSKEAFLTDSGKAFLRRARNIIKEAQESKDEIASIKGHLCGELRIGVGSFIEPYIRRAGIIFLKRYPDVLLHVQFDHAHVLNKMLRNEELDLAFTMNTAYHYEGIESKPCVPFSLSAIMSKRNKLADKDSVSFDDFMQSKVIMPDVGERVFNTFQKYTDFDLSKLQVAAVVSNASAALMVLDELDFVSFLPSDFIITSRNLVAKPIEGLDMQLTSNAHWMKYSPLKASAKAFLEVIHELYG